MNNDVQPNAASSSSSSASISSLAVTAPDPTPHPRPKHTHSSSNVSKRRILRPSPTDFLSDRATSQLIRRVLCPQHVGDRGRATPPPIDELLPPLTSRNDVDLQLYAIIAIIIRDFVQTWYNKITPDEAFVAEIVQIIAHCTRALEQRLRKVDVEGLLFDELPDLLDKHVQAYRASRQPIVRPPIEVDAHEIYHSLCPLPYLSPIPRPERPGTIAEQTENEATYRQLLVQGVLAVLLPTEDLENECLTSLVGQIFSELIIGGVVAKKASEPWMIWHGLAILADVLGRRKSDAGSRPGPTQSGVAAARHASTLSITGLFWSVVHYAFVFTTMIRALIGTVAMCRTLPPRGQQLSTKRGNLTSRNDGSQTLDMGFTHTQPPSESPKIPILAFGIWPTISNLIEMDRRMPWLLGSLSMVQWLAVVGPGRVAEFDGVIDRLLSDFIQRHVLDPALLPTALRNLRGAVFPNNAMGTQTVFPPGSDQELRALRRKCAHAVWALVPRSVGRLYFGGSGSGSFACLLATWFGANKPLSSRSGPIGGVGPHDIPPHPGKKGPDADMIDEIEMGILDVFGDPYCNKHLMYSALELVLVRLMPELAEKGIVDLWEERLS